MEIVCITVSTNYSDLLDIIIPQNHKFFKKWYVITSENDIDTIDCIKKHNCSNIEMMYFDFKSNNNIFNKGGAIRYCQNIVSLLDYKGLVLLLDSDIYLPDNFMEIINGVNIADNTLYGTNKRYDYHSYLNFINNKIDFDYPWSKEFQGYFQLYIHNEKLLYDESYNCSECDLKFQKYFSSKIIIPNLNVSHLGKPTINWNGRTSHNDFIKN